MKREGIGMTTALTLFVPEVFNIFCRPNEVIEVRILKVFGKSSAWGSDYAKGIVSGYFDDHKSFCEAVGAADKDRHGGIYFTLQVIDPRLIGRAFNRLKAAKTTTSDQNVIAYRWLPIDIDPVRPSGIPSSDKELMAAIELRDKIAAFAVSELKFAKPIKAISGNGGHLLFRLPDLPVPDESKLFVCNTLTGLADQFSTENVHIDTSVHNPARIWKLYGTIARKGDEVPAGTYREARPYRKSYIDDLGEFADG
jgi:hypothetical protein